MNPTLATTASPESHAMLQPLIQRLSEAALQIKTQTPLLVKAKLGVLTAPEFERYLANLAFLFAETPRHLAYARDVAAGLGLTALAHTYAAKIKEETGHEEWAKNDLAKRQATHLLDNQDVITPEARELATYVQQSILADPRHYILYMYCAEGITVLLGDEFVRDCDQNCGLRRDGFTAITHHVEKDAGHTAEDLDLIREHVLQPTGPYAAIGSSEQIMEGYLQKISAALSSFAKMNH